MISKQRIKLIHSLEQKKHRDEHNLFIGEGCKVVGELLLHFDCKYMIATEEWTKQNPALFQKASDSCIVTQEELAKASLLKTPQHVLALFAKREELIPSPKIAKTELCLALDSIQDPGNLGTIIRIANWFGIKHMICSQTTADAYSPKVIQATMGSLSGVKIFYTDLCKYLKETPADIPVYGTFLEGDNIYNVPLSANGIIVMGNEGNGISPQIKALVTRKLFIPPYSSGLSTTESLNVGVATAITCAEFRRRLI